MNAPVVIRRPIPADAPSAIDALCMAHLELLMLGADLKNVALRALLRLGARALADIEGDDAASGVLATLARQHAVKAVRVPAGRKRS